MHAYLEMCPEVLNALQNGDPVVALESTIISHGMSYPENIESAKKSEEEIRQQGAVPATIAVMKGKIKIGLSGDELKHFGKDQNIRKASRRDLPMILAKKEDGATTVATTMIGAAMAGIHVFATGGIGGVHRGAAQTFDISADLMELAKTNVADAFPGFYVRDSGFPVDDRVDDLTLVAKALHAKWQMGLDGGMVVANPIPEAFEMNPDFISESINEAVHSAEKQRIKGKSITPFILSHLHQATEGKSLQANKELVYHNARVAAKLAVAYSKLNR